MSLALMSNPVGFPLEGLRLHAFREAAGKWPHILVNMLGPVGWRLDLLHLKADGALELGR
jgi:hypothetical protein